MAGLQDCSSSKHVSIVSRISGLMSHFQDGGHDVISRRKVSK